MVPGDQLVAFIQPSPDFMGHGRPEIVCFEVLFACVNYFDGFSRSLGSNDCLDQLIRSGPSAESASQQCGVNVNLLRRQSRDFCCHHVAYCLTLSGDIYITPVRSDIRRAGLGLHGGMGDTRNVVGRLVGFLGFI